MLSLRNSFRQMSPWLVAGAEAAGPRMKDDERLPRQATWIQYAWPANSRRTVCRDAAHWSEEPAKILYLVYRGGMLDGSIVAEMASLPGRLEPDAKRRPGER